MSAEASDSRAAAAAAAAAEAAAAEAAGLEDLEEDEAAQILSAMLGLEPPMSKVWVRRGGKQRCSGL